MAGTSQAMGRGRASSSRSSITALVFSQANTGIFNCPSGSHGQRVAHPCVAVGDIAAEELLPLLGRQLLESRCQK